MDRLDAAISGVPRQLVVAEDTLVIKQAIHQRCCWK